MFNRKIKKYIIITNIVLVTLAIPASLFSRWISANLLQEVKIEPVQKIESEQSLDLEVYDNFADGVGVKFFQNIIIDQIDQAESEITIAIYAFNITEIKDALLRAKVRGVKINLLYSLKNATPFETFWADALSQIEPIYIGQNVESTNYSMHHKFMIVDHKTLLTGSWNWSYLQEDLDPNILMKITNKEIIDSYQKEADRLLSQENGYNKFKVTDYRPWTDLINFKGGSTVEIWFSPGRERYSIQNRIIEMIDSAKTQIDVANTIIDSTEISSALVKKARDGVKVRVIFDHLNLAPDVSIYNFLQKSINIHHLNSMELIVAGENNVNDKGEYSIFHHHNLIIDNLTVLSGSANWTFGGFFLNDENFLIIKDPKIAQRFGAIFENYIQKTKY